MSFKAEQKYVYDLLNRQTYRIPRNQRRYVWETRNLEELFEDISIVAEGTFESHFIGSFVLKDEGREKGLPMYTIIDGQQRIITLTILLASILYWLRKKSLYQDFEGTKQYVVAKDDKANDVVMVNSDYHFSLKSIIEGISEINEEKLKKISITAFLEQYSNSIDDRDKNIINAFKFFLTTIKEKLDKEEDKGGYLVSLRDAVVNVSYVSIISSSEEDSYTIFEILNARGIDLEDHELLKNYIMRYIQPEESRDEARIKWGYIESKLGSNIKRFVKHYATHKYEHNNRGLTEYKIIQSANKGRNTEKLLDDLRKKADYYSIILNPSNNHNEGVCLQTENRVFAFFRKKRQEQLRPVLLSLIHRNRTEDIPDELYNKVLSFIYNFYVCYKIIGEENSNKLTNVVYKYAEKIENEYSPEVLEEFVTELKKKLPSREVFINAFKNVGWTHRNGFYEGDKNKEKVKTVLEVWERHINGDECIEDFSIEHILDESVSEEYGQIGNLIPLEERMNNNLNRKSFKEKLERYSDSCYRSAREFSNRYKDTEFIPEKRTQILAIKFYDEVLKLEI